MKNLKKTKLTKRSVGRPKVHIDWDEVGFYLEAGVTARDIAASVGIHEDTFHKRCEADNNVIFSDFCQEKRKQGYKKILGKQYQKAISGDNTMLIWVGKQQCEQKDDPKTTSEFNGILASLLDVFKIVKSEDDFKVTKEIE